MARSPGLSQCPHSVRRAIQAALAALVLGAGWISVIAQTVSTTPVGVVWVPIAAGSATVPSVNTFSVPLRDALPATFVGQATGRISSVSASTITCTGAGWSPNALSRLGSPYYLRITSGAASGRTLQISPSVPNTDSTVTVLNQGTDLTALGIRTGSSGDTFEMFLGFTLSTLFSTTTLAGTSSASADVVMLHDGVGWREYYFHSTALQWRTGSVPSSQNNVAIRPDSGVIFYRRGSTALTYGLIGTVPSVNLKVVVNNVGVTFVGGVYPVNQTLAGAAYHALPNWRTAGNVATADKVTFFGGIGFDSYHFNQSAAQWRKGSVPVSQSNVTIPSGRPVILERSGGTAGVTVLERVLPYTL